MQHPGTILYVISEKIELMIQKIRESPKITKTVTAQNNKWEEKDTHIGSAISLLYGYMLLGKSTGESPKL